ncbi:MAG: hypothetical protein A2Y10_11845 [Planctomycetes bacterium GWF2_41_51]|nr:MAG: hypothetical protein A2Y10_11845 [Planctomycetes bacterium GWF2_41_51]
MVVFFLIFAVFGLAVILFKLFLWWKIFSKAGYSGAFAFLILVPFVGNLIVLCVLAFSNWPILSRAVPPVPQI